MAWIRASSQKLQISIVNGVAGMQKLTYVSKPDMCPPNPILVTYFRMECHYFWKKLITSTLWRHRSEWLYKSMPDCPLDIFVRNPMLLKEFPVSREV